MTPFAQLGNLEKRATAAQQPAPRPFHNPFQADDAQAVTRTGVVNPTPEQTGGFWNGAKGIWNGMEAGDKADLAMAGVSAIPVVGAVANGIYSLGRAGYHATQGNWGRAAGSLTMGALGIIPGAATAAAVGKFGATGARVAAAAGRAATATKALPGVARARTAVEGVRGGKTAWNMAQQTAIDTAAGALPNTGEAAARAAAAAAATQAATPMLDPNQSFNHYLASITAGGQP